MMSDRPGREPDVLHRLSNYLSVIMGFCEVLLSEIPEDDARRSDILEICHAAEAALDLVPQLAKRIN